MTDFGKVRVSEIAVKSSRVIILATRKIRYLAHVRSHNFFRNVGMTLRLAVCLRKARARALIRFTKKGQLSALHVG
jgi:hypothetical protein